MLKREAGMLQTAVNATKRMFEEGGGVGRILEIVIPLPAQKFLEKKFGIKIF